MDRDAGPIGRGRHPAGVFDHLGDCCFRPRRGRPRRGVDPLAPRAVGVLHSLGHHVAGQRDRLRCGDDPGRRGGRVALAAGRPCPAPARLSRGLGSGGGLGDGLAALDGGATWVRSDRTLDDARDRPLGRASRPFASEPWWKTCWGSWPRRCPGRPWPWRGPGVRWVGPCSALAAIGVALAAFRFPKRWWTATVCSGPGRSCPWACCHWRQSRTPITRSPLKFPGRSGRPWRWRDGGAAPSARVGLAVVAPGGRAGFTAIALAYGLGIWLLGPWFDRRGVEWAFYESAGRQLDAGMPLTLLYDDWDRNPYESPFGSIPHDLGVRLFYLGRPASWDVGPTRSLRENSPRESRRSP